MARHEAAKAQDADPVGQTLSVAQASKGAVQRRIKQGLLVGKVTQTEQFLQQMKRRHGLVCKWWASGGFGRRRGRERRHKLTQGYNALREFKQFHLARSPGAQLQPKGFSARSRNIASTIGVSYVSGEFLTVSLDLSRRTSVVTVPCFCNPRRCNADVLVEHSTQDWALIGYFDKHAATISSRP